jgi:hypothetical protein
VTLGVLHQATAAGIVAVWVAWLHHERHGRLAFQPRISPAINLSHSAGAGRANDLVKR